MFQAALHLQIMPIASYPSYSSCASQEDAIRVSPKEVRKKVNRFLVQAQVDWQLELGVITKSYDPSYLAMEASDVSLDSCDLHGP